MARWLLYVFLIPGQRELQLVKVPPLLGWKQWLLLQQLRTVRQHPIKHQIIEDMVKQIGDHASSVQRAQLQQLLLELSDIFAATSNDFSHTDLVKHHIDTGNAHPIH